MSYGLNIEMHKQVSESLPHVFFQRGIVLLFLPASAVVKATFPLQPFLHTKRIH